ncbi:MAG: hypothetical protein R3286_12010 [Gammaproteobacteria bacterium]|nr:hypothetical protein [Gammaproteobacteria bacterium]
MLFTTSTQAAEATRRVIDVHGQRYELRGYVGASPTRGTYVEGNERNASDLPQGFLVDQPPGSVTPPHFHETPQFQVFVGGSGRLGKKRLRPLSVQFAAGHTPYGPIVAGDDGVRYFTLRRSWDPGAKYLPAMRNRFVRGRQRQRLACNIELQSARALGSRTRVEVATLIEPEADGLHACLVAAGPHAACEGPDPGAGGGQYYVVVNGSLAHGDEMLPALSCLFATPDEPSPVLRAGSQGVELLVLGFPAADPA